MHRLARVLKDDALWIFASLSGQFAYAQMKRPLCEQYSCLHKSCLNSRDTREIWGTRATGIAPFDTPRRGAQVTHTHVTWPTPNLCSSYRSFCMAVDIGLTVGLTDLFLSQIIMSSAILSSAHCAVSRASASWSQQSSIVSLRDLTACQETNKTPWS